MRHLSTRKTQNMRSLFNPSVPPHPPRLDFSLLSQGNFGLKLFQALNPDPKLLAELFCTQLDPPMRPPQPPLATGIGALGKRQLEESLAPPKRAWSPEEEAVVQAELACMDTEESLAAELEMKMEEALPPVGVR